jgi:hypothetical protein
VKVEIVQQLDGGAWPLEWRCPGFDFLAAYYFLRYFTEVAPPSYAPWPAFPLASR